MRVAPRITLDGTERSILEKWARDGTVSARLSFRARIILLAAGGKQNRHIAAELGTTPATVSRWRKRFHQKRITGIEKDAPRSPRHAAVETRNLIVRTTLGEKPQDGQDWTTRKLANRLGVSHATVQRVWRAAGLSR